MVSADGGPKVAIDGRFESIHMMSKRLWQQGVPKEDARSIIKTAFADELKLDKKRLVNLIMTYTRTFYKKPPPLP